MIYYKFFFTPYIFEMRKLIFSKALNHIFMKYNAKYFIKPENAIL